MKVNVFENGDAIFKCMASSECSGRFTDRAFQASLDSRTYAKLHERFTISFENLSGIISCASCSKPMDISLYQGVDAKCPACKAFTCTGCKELRHFPLLCNEARSDARKQAEEAMSNIKIRECVCKKRFVKSSGCNAIACACGATMCYVCRQSIDKNSHYCQTFECSHKDCGKCSLYSETAIDDLWAIIEIGVQHSNPEITKFLLKG